jgi:hypothetical protein
MNLFIYYISDIEFNIKNHWYCNTIVKIILFLRRNAFMALGNSNSYNNNGKNQYIPVYYSRYNTANKDGVDPSLLGYTFYNGMLKLTISPAKPESGDKVSYDHENAAVAWLTHTKARMLYDQIQKVLKGEIENGGVSTGSDGLVRFIDGKELGINKYCLIINKINEEGQVLSAYAYEFKANHFAVENFDPKDAKHKKQYYNTLEVEQLCDLLKSYYESMSGAVAYSVMDAFRFTTDTNNTKLDLIMSKLGVEYKHGTTSRSNNSYFDREGSASSSEGRSIRTATMDELE